MLASLVARAEADSRVIGSALVGSAARGAEDEWSDIDLALQLAPDVDEQSVVDEWTDFVGGLSGLADTLDVWAGTVRYRVFFLASSLQIDVSFWPHDQFRATEPGFRILFGTPNAPSEPTPPDLDRVIGMGWLYAIHARSAIARGRLWQATIMLDELRGSLIALMCARSELNPWHGRDVDRLPAGDLAALEASRPSHVSPGHLDLSRILLARQFLDEVARHDPERAARLRAPFAELARPVR